MTILKSVILFFSFLAAVSCSQVYADDSCRSALKGSAPLTLSELADATPASYSLQISEARAEEQRQKLNVLIHESFDSFYSLIEMMSAKRFSDQFQKDPKLQKKVKKKLKRIKRLGNRVRAHYSIYSTRHRPPQALQRFIKRTGLAIDHTVLGQPKKALPYIKAIRKTQNVWLQLPQDITSTRWDRPKRIAIYILSQFDYVEDYLSKKKITAYELHKIKKTIRNIGLANIFSLEQTEIMDLVFKTIGSEFDSHKDPIVEKKLRGGKLLSETKVSLKSKFRTFLIDLLSRATLDY